MIDILCDCDGLLSNFVGSALERIGRKRADHDTWRSWSHYLEWGVSDDEFYKAIAGRQFWLDLEPYPWASALLSTLQGLGDVTIATSPTKDPEFASARTIWLVDRMGVDDGDIMIGRKKRLMANARTVLIDDRETNVSDFKARGGHAILFPAPWNQAWKSYSWLDVLRKVQDFRDAVERRDRQKEWNRA